MQGRASQPRWLASSPARPRLPGYPPPCDSGLWVRDSEKGPDGRSGLGHTTLAFVVKQTVLRQLGFMALFRVVSRNVSQ